MMRAEDRLIQGFVQIHPIEAAQHIETLDPENVAQMLLPLPALDIATVLGACQSGQVARILEYLPIQQGAEIISSLHSSVAFVVFRQLQPTVQSQLIGQLGSHQGQRFLRAIHQPTQTAGSLADPRVLTLPPDIPVAKGIRLVQRNPRQAMYYVYVVDRDAKLEGVVTLKQLLVVDSQDFIGSVMNDQVVTLPAEVTNDEIVGHPHWEQFHTLPVVDQEGIFVGVLRYRTLQQVREETVSRRTPGSLPTALIQLWEAYSLAGIRVMTELSETTRPTSESNTSDSPTVSQHL